MSQINLGTLCNDDGSVKDFAVISAENPNGQTATEQENEKRTQKLIKELEKLGLVYLESESQYNKGGKSFYVFKSNFEQITKLAKDFNQECFFWGQAGKLCFYKQEENGVFREIECIDLNEIKNNPINRFPIDGEFVSPFSVKIFKK